jgi:AraC-like DNA-binding protein
MKIELPKVIDPLGEALHFLRISGIFYARSEFTAPWALAMPPMRGFLMLHVVTSGQCWLEVDGIPNRLLRAGDLALVPRGEGHQIAGKPGRKGAELFKIPRERVSERYEILRLGGGGAPTTLVCGVFQFDQPAAFHLATLLPRTIVVENRDSHHTEWIQSTLRMMASEAKELRPGGETVITRLADILVIHAIRSWISRDPTAQTGWLGALHDKHIGRVISLVHRDPARTWTLESLACEVAMSRSAFAARFTQLVGEPAMHYVTRCKMHTALAWIREQNCSVGELSHRLGYESEAAFSRAFKRYTGVSPGAARKDKETELFPLASQLTRRD